MDNLNNKKEPSKCCVRPHEGSCIYLGTIEERLKKMSLTYNNTPKKINNTITRKNKEFNK